MENERKFYLAQFLATLVVTPLIIFSLVWVLSLSLLGGAALLHFLFGF